MSFNIMQKMIKTNLNELKTRLAIHLLIGFFGMLSYHLLDHIYYLNFWLPLLIVRLFAMAYCFIFYFVIEKIPEKLVSVIIAETIKGYGLRCMENIAKFHFRVPTEEELALGRSYE